MEYLPYALVFAAGAVFYHVSSDAVIPLPKDAELTPTNYYRDSQAETWGPGETIAGYHRIPGFLGLPKYEIIHRDGTRSQSYFPPDMIHTYNL